MSVYHRLNSGRRRTFLLGAFLLFSLLISPVFLATDKATAAPGKINYQGRLADAGGTAKPDGQYNMKFRIHSASSGGSLLWSEVHETTNRVTVTNGQFSVQLGDVTTIPASVFASDTTFFEIELPTPATATCSTSSCGVYTEGAMTPRQPIGSSAYALTAGDASTLDGIDSTQFARNDAGNTLTGTNLFKNASNSTAAFDVQTSSSVSLLNVDTTNSKVLIGTNGAGGAAITMLNNGRVGIGNPTPGYLFDVAGDALFKNATDTVAAFQVQSSIAATMFIVDTLNSQVEIGSPTADATGVVLILDTKNTAGDPTGVIGAMYYNSNMGKFRCYEGAAWSNCIAQNVVTLASDVTNNNVTGNTIADVTGLSFSVVAGQTYRFSAVVHYTAAATTTGSRWSINGPATTALAYTSRYGATTTTETFNYAAAYNAPASVNVSSPTTSGNIALIDGMLTPSAGGYGSCAILFRSVGIGDCCKGGQYPNLVVNGRMNEGENYE